MQQITIHQKYQPRLYYDARSTYHHDDTEQTGCISRLVLEPGSFSRRILLHGIKYSTQPVPHYVTVSRTSRLELYIQCSGAVYYDVLACVARSGVSTANTPPTQAEGDAMRTVLWQQRARRCNFVCSH
jgi:hypothetical protein